MNRRVFIGGTSASVLAAAISFAAVSQAEDERVAGLETDVAELDMRVSALETQVALLDGDIDNGESTVDSEGMSASSTISGAGTVVSDPFRLSAGRYRVNVTVKPVSGFAAIILEVFDPSGASELVLNEFGESKGEWSGSAIYNAPVDGEYFVSVSNTTGPWSITFEPF